MVNPPDDRLNASQLMSLREAFASGAEEASAALARWVNAPAVMTIESVEQLSIADAVNVLGESEIPICCCALPVSGPLAGALLLLFDDQCGWALADLVLGRPTGTSTAWNELERSAALESTNIVGTNYSNGLANYLSKKSGEVLEMIPAPPIFQRDFMQSLLEFALMRQASENPSVIIGHAQFQLRERSLSWQLLFIPDAEPLQRLGTLLNAV